MRVRSLMMHPWQEATVSGEASIPHVMWRHSWMRFLETQALIRRPREERKSLSSIMSIRLMSLREA